MQTVVNDLASRLTQAMGTGGRVAVVPEGSPLGAFGWAAGGPSTVVGRVPSSLVSGGSLSYLRVDRAGTPAAVPENTAKPTLANVTADSVALSKFAGLSSFPVERAIYSADAIIPVVADTLYSQCLIGADTAAWAVLGTDAGIVGTPAASWAAAILDGIGQVVMSGGNPDLLIMSATDYAAAVDSPGAGYYLAPTDAVQSLFGLTIVIAAGAGAATGTAYVADSKALLAVEDAGGPVAVLDVTSGLATNVTKLAVELFTAFVVTLPGSVCKISTSAAAAAKKKAA